MFSAILPTACGCAIACGSAGGGDLVMGLLGGKNKWEFGRAVVAHPIAIVRLCPVLLAT